MVLRSIHSHPLSTELLQDGQVAEQGTHAELLVAGGLYATLVRRQLLAGGTPAASAAPPAATGTPDDGHWVGSDGSDRRDGSEAQPAVDDGGGGGGDGQYS